MAADQQPIMSPDVITYKLQDLIRIVFHHPQSLKEARRSVDQLVSQHVTFRKVAQLKHSPSCPKRVVYKAP